MPRRRVAIRVNGSDRLGFGHIGRCRNLAAAFKRLNYSCRFVRTGVTDEVLDGLDVAWLDIDERDVGGIQDAELTLAAATDEGDLPSAVVVDDYTIGFEWERRIREFGVPVVAIDDLADRPHDCDVLIDSNPLPEDRYRGLVRSDTLCLIGPQYALLDMRGDLTAVQDRASGPDVDRVFVCFGGGIHSLLVGMVLEASRDRRLNGLHFDIVTADDALARGIAEEVRRDMRNGSRSSVNLWGWVADLDDLLANCDVAIGAGGSLSLERIRRGIPSAVVSVAENQVETSRALEQQGLLRYLGEADTCTPDLIADALAELIEDQAFCQSVQQNGPRVYDGNGALRCAAAIQWNASSRKRSYQ